MESHTLPVHSLESIKIRAVSGDLPPSGGAMLPSPLTPVLSSGSLLSHQFEVKEHYLSHEQTCRIWVDSHASDTRLYTTLPASQESNREFKPVTPHSPGEVSGTQHLLLFGFSILQLMYFFLEKGEQGEEEFLQRTLFCLL